MAVPLSVGRERSIKALEAAHAAGDFVCVSAQKSPSVEDPREEEFFAVGVLAEVAHFLRMPDGTLKVFLQGLRRAKLVSPALGKAGFWETGLDYPEERWTPSPELEALSRQAFQLFEQIARTGRRVTPETVSALRQLQDPPRLADTLAANALTKLQDRQALLELFDPRARLEKLVVLLENEAEILGLEKRIHSRVQNQIQKTQKEYYLTEQMKAIQKELRQKDDHQKDLDEIREKIVKARMPPPAAEAALKELGRLSKMAPMSPESTVCRTYLDWMSGLPWSTKTRDQLDLARAAKILDEDHYGLEKAKERVLEYLAVCRMTRRLRGPILCFVGPPGVGKTSIGRSIARAVGRRFVRLSLGGVRDEAEIRGHRRTYIGSLPGRIIQGMRKAKSRNPVFLLDEVDKMGTDWRGDPAAALLEVLDPEQNCTFSDHYLDVEFDLSATMFLCTANTLDGIPVPLQDRLEIIRFPGYTQREKNLIGRGFLLPKTLREHGLKPSQLTLDDGALGRLIQEYTREAGVRSLERELASLCRKAARRLIEGKLDLVAVTAETLPQFLGAPKYTPEERSRNEVGVATGLAWTEVGGTLLPIEALSLKGKPEVLLTGKLGSVMQESAKAAYSHVRSIAASLGIQPSAFKDCALHVHVPEGAVPKDGPSAGIAIATAIASLFTGRPVRPDVAMTGELTLRGRVLPIGGLKEKVLAAHRMGVKTVLYPSANAKDLEEIPTDVLESLEMVPVSNLSDVLERALLPAPPHVRRVRRQPLPPPAAGPSADYATPQA
ncbi:MAG TPA: endopeptidase La [Elusimicrobia bacterium]|nr:endopeptidase La [Elusimicrobiota bacterium]